MDADSTSASPPLRAHLLGRVRLTLGERLLDDGDWPRRSARGLLLLLLATSGHRLPRERAQELLWPEAVPDAARNALSVALHGLRHVLEPERPARAASAYIETGAEELRIRTHTGFWVDTDAFEAVLKQADTSTGTTRCTYLREAVAIYDGDLLAHELVIDWPIARREALRRGWRRAVLALAEIEREAGRPLAAVPPLEQVLAGEPTDETALRELMRALAAAGRPDEALHQFQHSADALRDEFGIEPAVETQALVETLRRRPAPPAASVAFPSSPPRFDTVPAPLTPLIGRDRELEAVQDLLWLSDVRMVTVTGTGGIGKTRLAVEAARQIADDFTAGACWIPLASTQDSTLVLPAIGRALGVEEKADQPVLDVLSEVARAWDLLLVLDNAEQVAPAGRDLSVLLTACPKLKLLVTSRQPLRIRAEHELPLPPLAVPPPAVANDDDVSAEQIGRYEAVALFTGRARAVNPDFALTPDNAAIVAELCARLDGLPLAIELAAARSHRFSPARLLAGLTDRFTLLTTEYQDLPPRHHSMRDAIRWSYDLLTSEEQAAFRQLAIFAGGWTLEAAARVLSGGREPGAVRDMLASLSAKHLLVWDETDEGSRLATLETIREYGLELLEASGGLELTRRAHADYYLALAERAESALTGSEQTVWLDRLEAEHDNLRSSLSWSCQHPEPEVALRLSGALPEFWRARGHLTEGRAWLERALSLGGDEPSSVRAKVHHGAGALARIQGDIEGAIAHLNVALGQWRAVANQRGEGRSLVVLATCIGGQGDYDRASQLNEDALSIFETIGDRWGIAETLNGLGVIACDRGEFERSSERFERSLPLFRDLDDRKGQGKVLNNYGVMSFWQADFSRAVTLFDESLAMWRSANDRPHIAIVLANLGEALRAEGVHERAMAIAADGLQLSRGVGDKRSAATALFILGSLQQLQRIDPRAAEPLSEGLLLFQQVNDKRGIAWCLESLAGPATARGEPELAARLLGAAEALREAVRVPVQLAERPAYERHRGAAHEALGDVAFDAAWATGRQQPIAAVITEAVTLAMSPETAPVSPRSSTVPACLDAYSPTDKGVSGSRPST